MLPEHAQPQDHAERARELAGRGPCAGHHTRVRAVAARSQEGRDAVREPQVHPEARSAPAAVTRWCQRRVLVGSHCTELAANGKAVDRRFATRTADGSLKEGRRAPDLPYLRRYRPKHRAAVFVAITGRGQESTFSTESAVSAPSRRIPGGSLCCTFSSQRQGQRHEATMGLIRLAVCIRTARKRWHQ